MKKIITALFLVTAIMLTSCDDAKNHENVKSVNAITHVVDYGNGVVYFPYAEAAFANHLSAFIAKYPDLKIVCMSGDGTSNYGRDCGYFVVFEKRETKSVDKKQ